MAERLRGPLLRTKAVYYWEELFAGNLYHTMIELPAARALVRLISREYGIPIPILRRYRFRDSPEALARASMRPATIEFNSKYKAITAMLLAHEMAHNICGYYGFIEDSLNHGPIWLGVYVRILNDYAIVPFSATVPSLNNYDLGHICLHCTKPDELWDFEEE